MGKSNRWKYCVVGNITRAFSAQWKQSRWLCENDGTASPKQHVTVKIQAIRKACYGDLMAQYENPMEQPCNVAEGQIWYAVNGEKPEGFCDSAWETLAPFVRELAQGGGNFYDGWMKNPRSAMLSCNDGFRPVSFYVEVVADGA